MKFKIIAGILMIVLTLGLYCVKNFIVNRDNQLNADILLEEADHTTENSTGTDTEAAMQIKEKAEIIVDVGGEVYKPGVVHLPEESRVFEAIAKAGGLKKSADTKRINLAALLKDGEKVYIPGFNEVVAQQSASGNSNLININTADAETLQKIKGIGPSTANKIIAYRESNGQFEKIEEMMNISGIGEKTFAKLKNQITIN